MATDADGNGYSLALLDSNLDNALASSWDIQLADMITPGAENIFCPTISNGITVTDPSCPQSADGQITLASTGGNGAPFTYQWSHGATTAQVSNLTPGSYIASTYDQYGCEKTDTIVVNAAPTPASINLNIINVTNLTVLLNWNNIPNNTNYYIHYREVGQITWTTVSTTTNLILINNLLSCTDYEIRIGGDCSFDGQNNFNSIVNFSTTGCFQCTSPAGLYQFNIQNVSAIVTWDVLVGAVSYTLKYRKIGDTNWNSYNSVYPLVVLFGISACTDYEWTIETTCYDGSTASNSPIMNLSTVCKNERQQNTLESEIKVYPNPAKDFITIEQPTRGIEWIEIRNIQGQLIYHSEQEELSYNINISGWPQGLYTIWTKSYHSFFVKE